MKSYDIQYNGGTGKSCGVLLYDYPVIEQAKRNYDVYSVPGRNGELISADEYLSNVTIKCTFSVISKTFMQHIRKIKQWLSGTGKLILSDTPETFWEVLKVEYDSVEREMRRYGRFTVNFVCYPYEFRIDGQRAVGALKFNPCDLCMPLYSITGEGNCSLTVNGYTMSADVGQNLTIDTRRQIAYREDGGLMNTAVRGDYEKLWIPNGDCKVSITSGFKLQITPRWGYNA